MKNQCLEVEMEYREWRETPLWYCVKTTFQSDGTIESEIVADKKTKKPVAIPGYEKPLDSAFETATEITYYSYHAGYKEAERQMNAVKRVVAI